MKVSIELDLSDRKQQLVYEMINKHDAIFSVWDDIMLQIQNMIAEYPEFSPCLESVMKRIIDARCGNGIETMLQEWRSLNEQ